MPLYCFWNEISLLGLHYRECNEKKLLPPGLNADCAAHRGMPCDRRTPHTRSETSHTRSETSSRKENHDLTFSLPNHATRSAILLPHCWIVWGGIRSRRWTLIGESWGSWMRRHRWGGRTQVFLHDEVVKDEGDTVCIGRMPELGVTVLTEMLSCSSYAQVQAVLKVMVEKMPLPRRKEFEWCNWVLKLGLQCVFFFVLSIPIWYWAGRIGQKSNLEEVQNWILGWKN